MTHLQRRTTLRMAPAMVGLLIAMTQPEDARTQASQPPAEVRAIVEGTWTLIEWHVDGRVLRPPEMDGRWMVHDGLVMATRHRDGADGYESTAGYGSQAHS